VRGDLTQSALAPKVVEKRGWGIVPIWVERFALAVLAAVLVGVVILNVLKIDGIQRAGLGMGILGLSIFLAQTLYLSNKAKAAAEPPQQVEQKKPEVQQSSQGANSPNTSIVGNNNTVNIGDPKVSARLDEITRLLKAQGEGATPEKLLRKYPLGYVIFDVDYTNSVFPYHTQALDNWEFDWSVVNISENDPKMLVIRMPDVRRKGGSTFLRNVSLANPKKIGFFGGFFDDGVIDIKVEILAISEKGIVFLIGFTTAEPKKPS
jgi:hypothetical protein